MSLSLLTLLSPFATGQPHGLQPQGPDVPTMPTPVASVVAFDDETWSWTEGARTRQIVVPSVAWNRVVLVYDQRPLHEPWDRLCGFAIEGVDVLRCTTPRSQMTLTKDVTAFASLLPPGATVNVSANTGSYDGWAQIVDARLDFYDDATGALVERHDAAVGAFRWNHMYGRGHRIDAAVAFPAGAPTSVIAELTLSGHGNDEFWEASSTPIPRFFDVYVDNQLVGSVKTVPDNYANVGFYGSTGETLHPIMWWSAHRALDAAGVHTGVGEIPAYRFQIDAAQLGLFSGARQVSVVESYGGSTWVVSLSFLLDA